MNILKSRSEITLKTNTHVETVNENEVVLSNGEVIPCGITVWSTGKKISIYEGKEIEFV
jgi:NADH dehydrogenase FAD-containing subunit